MDFAAAKKTIQPWREALYHGDEKLSLDILKKIAPKATIHMSYPFGDFTSAERFFQKVFSLLFKAWPDLERRDTIVIAGRDEKDELWIGCGGYYTGTFLESWLDIPPTGHQASMRFHEFYKIENEKITEIQAIWDIPEVMIQTGVWPLAPSLGKEWQVPSPATQDGLVVNATEKESLATREHIIDMLNTMKKHPQEPPAAMELERFWHEKMNWYGPSGIGTARGIAGFRHWHQIPFLNGMPDRGQYLDEISYHFIAEGNYAGVTGWPDMMQTLSDAGWLGLPPVNKKISMRSLDFWRLEKGKIRENWVLVDLLDMYHQIGIDVFARLKEFNKARNLSPIKIIKDY